MSLKYFVHVSSISNLSDARYCSGMMVDSLGYNLDENSNFLKSGFEKMFYMSCSHNHGFDKLYEYFENNDYGTINENL